MIISLQYLKYFSRYCAMFRKILRNSTKIFDIHQKHYESLFDTSQIVLWMDFIPTSHLLFQSQHYKL